MSESRAERFRRLYEAYAPDVYDYALRRGASIELAEEVVAETMTVAWRRAETVPDAPLPWLCGVARKVMSNRCRAEERQEGLRSKVRGSLPPRASRGERGGLAGGAADHDGDLWTALAELSDDDRETLMLVYWDGLSRSEGAQAMGCSTTAFTVRLFRARRRLAACLQAAEQGMGTLQPAESDVKGA